MIKENFLSSFLLFAESKIIDSEYGESIFFIRLLTIFYGFLLPLGMMFLLGLTAFFCKERVFLKKKYFSNFYKFNKQAHNLIFIFLVFLAGFNTCVIFYYIIEIFIAKNYTFYGKQGSFTKIADYQSETHGQKGATHFVCIVLSGYAVHMGNFAFYAWYNKNKTNSFFSQKNLIDKIPKIISECFSKHIYGEKTVAIHKKTLVNNLRTRFFR